MKAHLSYISGITDKIAKILRKGNIGDPNLCKNIKKYRYKHEHKYATEIKLHFINIKELKYAYIQNKNKLARARVAYLWEEMWWLHAFELCYNEA